ncbi:unnamed protein product [Angiostrongylus costaricensis]|uniref:ANF_receptor domain-containing protein n=1 Tax=Angiostrongylus costaricensis TaxID=334426 RepID=A0A0R3PHJ0_ANGCS|nr:unnamed protein product [Angiostrongylus costaricensis]
MRKTLKIGMMFVENRTSLDPYVGYRTSASAVLIARDRIIREGLLPGIDFEFFHAFDECDEMKAAGITIAMGLSKDVDVILGPTCNTLKNTMSSCLQQESILNEHALIMAYFGWNQFAYIFEKQDSDPVCNTMKDDIQAVITQTEGQININYLAEITSMKPETIKNVLEEVAKRARSRSS